MPPHAFAHRFEVLAPLQAEHRGIVHQDLAVDAEHVEKPDVARAKRAVGGQKRKKSAKKAPKKAKKKAGKKKAAKKKAGKKKKGSRR